MMTPRLTSEFRVNALIRQCQAQGLFAALRHRGDPDRGGVLVKIDRFSAGCEMVEAVTDLDGQPAWQTVGAARGAESSVDAIRAEELIAKRRRVDRDLWVVEIEDGDATLAPADLPL